MFKKLFAAASIMAISFTFLISPVKVGAAEISVNPSPNSSFIFCLSGNVGSQAAPYGYNIIDKQNNVANIYVVPVPNPGSPLSPTCASGAPGLFLPAIPGHRTTYELYLADYYGVYSVAAISNVKVENTIPTSSNITKTCESGKTTFTINGTEEDKLNFISSTLNSNDFNIVTNGDSPLVISITPKNSSIKSKIIGASFYIKEVLPTQLYNRFPIQYTTSPENIQILFDIDPICASPKPILIGSLPTDLTTFCNAGFAKSPSSESKKRIINKSGTNVTSIDCPYKYFNPKEAIVIKNYTPDIICRYFNQASYDKLYKSGSVAKITETKVKNKTTYNCYF